MPAVWSSGSRFFDYALPLPWTWGLLHWPSLVLFGFLLARAWHDPGRWRAVTRLACVGTLLGTTLALVVFEEVRSFSLFLYIIVDAGTALLASGVIPLRAGNQLHTVSPRLRKALVAGPAAAVLAILVLGPLALPRYNFVMSDSEDLGPDRDVVRFWFHTRRAADDAASECPRLAALVDDGYRNSYARRGRARHRMFLLFRNREDIGRASAGNAWVTYSWWPDGREFCSADRDFRR